MPEGRLERSWEALLDHLGTDSAAEIQDGQHRLAAVLEVALHLSTDANREQKERFLADVQRAFFGLQDRLTAEVGKNPAEDPVFLLGQLSAAVHLAFLILRQTVPTFAMEVLIKSQVARGIARLVAEQGPLGPSEIANRLGKKSQNILSPLTKLVDCGLLRRDEFGARVLYSATGLLREALKAPGLQEEDVISTSRAQSKPDPDLANVAAVAAAANANMTIKPKAGRIVLSVGDQIISQETVSKNVTTSLVPYLKRFGAIKGVVVSGSKDETTHITFGQPDKPARQSDIESAAEKLNMKYSILKPVVGLWAQVHETRSAGAKGKYIGVHHGRRSKSNTRSEPVV